MDSNFGIWQYNQLLEFYQNQIIQKLILKTKSR